MTTPLRQFILKRGNTTVSSAYTGPLGEITYDTGLNAIRIHDGITPGGNLMPSDAVFNSLSSNLTVLQANVVTLFSNAAAQETSINLINANIGAYQIYANANAATQQTQIDLINANVTAANTAITSLISNAAVQAALLDTLTGNAATQSQVLDTLTSNAATQADALTTLLSNAVAQQTSLIDLVANAATQAQFISNTNANTKSYLAAFDGNIIPAANVTYSLGSEQFQWRDLWVSNNTIYIGNTPIRVDGGTLLVDGAPISGTYGNTQVATYLSQSNVTLGNVTITDNFGSEFQFLDGALRFPGGNGAATYGAYVTGSGGFSVYPTNDSEFMVQTFDTTPGVGSRQWKIRADGNLEIPDDATIFSDANVRIYATDNIAVATENGGTWLFGTDGTFSAPGEVYGQFFSLRGGNLNGTIGSLGYGGDDINLHSFANVHITTLDPESGPQWTFGIDGSLTFPDSTIFNGNTFTSPETNGTLKNFKWEFSDFSYGADTVTLQWNLLDTTFPQWYLTTNSQGNIYVFDGDAKTIGFLDNSINSGTVTFGTAVNNGAGGTNDIELTTVTGNAYVRTGSNSWKFDNTGVLTAPGNITTTGNISGGNIQVQNIRTNEETVHIGQGAGLTDQGTYGIAIGRFAGSQTQGGAALAIGSTAGNVSQGVGAVAVGEAAGRLYQGGEGVAIGKTAGEQNQGAYSIAIGSAAAYYQQRTGAIAIGTSAGALQQGNNAIAIGTGAGSALQGNNTIILNATGDMLDQTTANTFTVKPIRNASSGNVLYYDASSGEITYEVGSFVYGNTEVNAYLQELSSITFIGSPASISGVQNMTTSNINVTSNLTSKNLTVTGNIAQQSAYYETYANVTNSGGNLTCNFVNGATFYATLGANVTANFTNVVVTTGTAVGVTLIVDQGVTPYGVSNIQINSGAVQSIRWAGGIGPNTGTASNTDIMSFSLINLDGTAWRILGQISNYA